MARCEDNTSAVVRKMSSDMWRTPQAMTPRATPGKTDGTGRLTEAERVRVPWMSSLKVQNRLLYLLRMRKAFLLAKSSNWIRQLIPYLQSVSGTRAWPYCWQAKPTVGVYTMGMNSSMSEVSRR
ncbi:hypothetical protein EYF80_028880 [Liparis tanakae]|uniref:Uncharacterized protein n=1 Tax=Liparis tanakae TaxID=230148 RepID=A0A4Z2H6L1_9TELE|nr:hypothetical protein EYF80_028880 [Liparis tanakae]